MKKFFLFCTVISTVLTRSYAQSYTIDSVVIKENRFHSAFTQQNRNIQLLRKEQIKALPVKSVNELLSYISGADLRQRGPSGTQSDISIDGSTFDQVLVLINGIKMSDPQTGHHTLNIPVPLSAIDHIEVLRGPAASKYGVNAMAGAINIITSIPSKNRVDAQVYASSNLEKDTATGNMYYGWGAQASVALAGKKQSHIFSVAHDESNGYRYNTAFNAYRLFYQDRLELNKKNSLELMGGYIDNSFGANGFYSAPGDVNSKEKVQTALAGVTYTFRPNEKVSISPRFSYRYNNDDYIYIKQKPEVYHNRHETNVLTGEIQSTVQFKKGILGAGAELRNENINSSNLGKRSRNNIGLYAEYKHSFSKKLNAGIGLYGNYNTDYDAQLFPGIDIGYQVNRHIKLFADASAGQRLPTYTDLYYKGPINIGNDTLKPEYARYAEGGVQYSIPYFFARASYFYRHVTDFIDWVRATNAAPWQPRNFQSINTQGITLQLNWQPGNQLQLPGWIQPILDISYTYLQMDIEVPSAEISKYAIEALRHQLVVSSRNVLFDRFFLNIAARYQYRINANDYTLLDTRLGYQHKLWSVYADVNNLLATQYKEIGSVPLPGRWFTLGLRLSITGNK